MTDEFHPDGLPTPRRYFAMLAIAIGIAMAVLDGTVVNVALPSIAAELGASPSAAVWVINGYQLVIVVLLLPHRFAGRADRIPADLPVRRGGLYAGLARLRAVAHPADADRCPRRAGRRRCGDHGGERRAGPAHLSRRASRPRHRAERAGRGDRGRGRAVGRFGHPGGRDMAVAFRGQRAVRDPESLGRAAPAAVGDPYPAVRLDERAAECGDVRAFLRRSRRADPRRGGGSGGGRAAGRGRRPACSWSAARWASRCR